MNLPTTLTFPMILMMAVSAAVAVLVVFLKPLADDWFDRKKRRITFKLDRPAITRTPLPQVKLKFDNYEFDQLFGYDATVSNNTGRTLRNIAFELWSSPGIPAEGFCWVTCDGPALAATSQETGIAKWKIEQDEIGRGQVIALYIISTVEQSVSLRTACDLEIYSTTAGTSTNIARISTVQAVLRGLSWSAIAAAVSMLVGLTLQ